MSRDDKADSSENKGVISAKVAALILGSPRLRQQLLPEGPLISPYEILDYRSVLVLEDEKGSKAVFHRTQRIKFLQDGVEAILEHFWGDGVLVVDYQHSAGRIADSFKDEGRRHLVIELPRPMHAGEELTFTVQRTVLEGFRGAHEAVETTLDHPIHKLSRAIMFPKGRPCRGAKLVAGVGEDALSIAMAAKGLTIISTRVGNPRPYTPYTIDWSW